MTDFHPSRFAETLQTEMAVWAPPMTPAERDMESLRRGATRLVHGALLLTFAALAASYVWYAWLH